MSQNLQFFCFKASLSNIQTFDNFIVHWDQPVMGELMLWSDEMAKGPVTLNILYGMCCWACWCFEHFDYCMHNHLVSTHKTLHSSDHCNSIIATFICSRLIIFGLIFEFIIQHSIMINLFLFTTCLMDGLDWAFLCFSLHLWTPWQRRRKSWSPGNSFAEIKWSTFNHGADWNMIHWPLATLTAGQTCTQLIICCLSQSGT